jgi:hypothetical protein
MPPLIDSLPSPSQAKYTVSNADLARADKLRQCTSSLGYTQRWVRSKWAKEFELLSTSSPVASGDIDAVLDFYVTNAERLQKPRIQHAAQFRKCFGWLKDLMARDASARPQVRVSKEAEAVVSEIRHWGWPKGAADTLGQFVQLTIDNYSAAKARLSTYVKSNPEFVVVTTRRGDRRSKPAPDHVRLAHVLLSNLESSSAFAVSWARQAHGRLRAIEAKKYDRWEWRPGAEAFHDVESFRNKVSGDWGTKTWETLKKEVWE